ncbi:hypothetical protein C8R43DRAFT_571897 [Mycena crocata]|nr:hypothetical protein C8R43DRAFT_571897 [Mycena crocata]
MLDMDIDAFFEEQDARMNISDDDMDEFLARKAQARYYPPNLYDFSLQIPQDNSPSNSLPDQSHGVPPNNLISLQIPQDNSSSSQPRDVSANSSIRRSPRTKRKEPTSESIELQGPKRSKHVHGEVEEPPVLVLPNSYLSPKFPTRFPGPPYSSKHRARNVLRRRDACLTIRNLPRNKNRPLPSQTHLLGRKLQSVHRLRPSLLSLKSS